jgi:hypothetical protein
MDPHPPVPAKPDDRARRVRTFIIVLMTVFIAAPLVVYFILGNGAPPRP